jgi:hypothetical protein
VAGAEACSQASEVVPERVAVQHRAFFVIVAGCDGPGCPAFEFHEPLVAVGQHASGDQNGPQMLEGLAGREFVEDLVGHRALAGGDLLQ